MVWKAQIWQNRFPDPGRCWATPGAPKRVGAGPLQCFDGILNPFLMGRGSPGRDRCGGTPGYPPLAGPISCNNILYDSLVSCHRRL